MLSQFCIRRPIFATVLSLIIVLAGFVALRVLPLSQYPNISPPTVRVSATYDGADAETIARTVAAPIEDQLSGIEGLLYYTTSRTTPCSKSTTASARQSVAFRPPSATKAFQ